MSVVRTEWNQQALYDIRRDPKLVQLEESVAQQIADRANANGDGTYAVSSQQGQRAPQGRWRTTVITADARAMADNSRNNTLIRSMG